MTPHPETSKDEPVKIPLDKGMFALVDACWEERLNKYEWRAELFHASYYAVTNIIVRGHKKTLRMHRVVANTPPGKFPHHINHNSLDNRRGNLLNVTKQEHNELHSRSHIRIKYALPDTSGPQAFSSSLP